MGNKASTKRAHNVANRRSKKVRRQQKDRREAIRWEPDKEDRRDGSGRRDDDKTWDPINSKY